MDFEYLLDEMRERKEFDIQIDTAFSNLAIESGRWESEVFFDSQKEQSPCHYSDKENKEIPSVNDLPTQILPSEETKLLDIAKLKPALG